MAKRGAKKSSVDIIEKPELDLGKTDNRKLPNKVPDVFANSKKEDVDENNLEPMIRDIDILIAINDITGAKTLYHRLRLIHDKLSEEEKKKYFVQVEKIYKKLKAQDSFGAKLKGMFGKKK